MTENMNEKIVENEAYVPVEGALDKEQKTQEKMFTQSQLEEIISERLSRERRINDSLSSVKNFLKSASEKGLIKNGSYAEMAKELVERLSKKPEEAVHTAETVNETCDEVSNADTSSVADEDGKTNAENDGGNNGMEEKRDTGDFVSVLSALKAKYPRQTVEKLISTNQFERFAKGRSGSVEEIFDDFLSFISELDGRTEESDNDTNHACFASTAFSSHSGTPDMGTNLTRQQMEIAKSGGMSYREYQNLLESIPKRMGRTI